MHGGPKQVVKTYRWRVDGGHDLSERNGCRSSGGGEAVRQGGRWAVQERIHQESVQGERKSPINSSSRQRAGASET